MKYLIEDITYKNGTTRTDWKYPKRIGSVVSLTTCPAVGEPLYFKYEKYNDGRLVNDHFSRTSRVDDYDCFSYPNHLIIFTRNSIYYFKELED